MGWRYKAGLGMIGAFVLVWVAAAEVTQKIFVEYRQPFALTYIWISMMVVYIPVALCRDYVYSLVEKRCLRRSVSGTRWLDYYFGVDEAQEDSEAVLKGYLMRDMGLHEMEAGQTLLLKEEDELSFGGRGHELGWKEVVKCSLYLAPLWFATEYFSNSALAHTSVASTTVLTSTSGLFTLLIGASIGQETISIAKVSAVLITVVGVAMTTVGKTWASDENLLTDETNKHSITGDIFGLLSAVFYGTFTVLLKRFAGSGGEQVDVQKFFGYIGLFTLVGFWWLAWPLSSLGIGPEFSLPSSASIFEAILVSGFVGSVLSDYLWGLAVIWTTPLVATLGMSLTIPVAMLADMLVHGRQYSAVFIIGCVQVFLGFIIANVSDRRSCTRRQMLS